MFRPILLRDAALNRGRRRRRLVIRNEVRVLLVAALRVRVVSRRLALFGVRKRLSIPEIALRDDEVSLRRRTDAHSSLLVLRQICKTPFLQR